jgi:hypothetical protein
VASQRCPPGGSVSLHSLTSGIRPLWGLGVPKRPSRYLGSNVAGAPNLPSWRRWRSTGLEVECGLSARNPGRFGVSTQRQNLEPPTPGSRGADSGLTVPPPVTAPACQFPPPGAVGMVGGAAS